LRQLQPYAMLQSLWRNGNHQQFLSWRMAR